MRGKLWTHNEWHFPPWKNVCDLSRFFWIQYNSHILASARVRFKVFTSVFGVRYTNWLYFPGVPWNVMEQKIVSKVSCSVSFKPHPVISGLWGPGTHENCHHFKLSWNWVAGLHVILKNVGWYHSCMFLYSVGELKNNYFQFNETPT